MSTFFYTEETLAVGRKMSGDPEIIFNWIAAQE
jgi:hypothetical protein